LKKASIIIINYNDKTRVQRAIESALNQTFFNKEVIVVDDGSDKETREIYKRYKDIILVQREREDKHKRTVPQALNAGIEKYTGDYIAVLGSDNYYSHDFLKECMKYDYDVMFVDWDICGLKSRKIEMSKAWQPNLDLLRNYLNFCAMDHQCLLVKRSVQMAVGLCDERFPRSQDADMICRLMLHTDNWINIPKVLFHFEKHEKDQQKNLASVHGKVLWSLKNNINFAWILGLLKNGDPYNIMSYIQGVNDFMTKPEWKKDYDKSEFKEMVGMFKEKLGQEITE
jgi:glycosyltransferase involved in cell wall biosynthesis